MFSIKKLLASGILFAASVLSVVAPATADEAGWKKLAEIRESYAALNHYQDDTRCLFSSGTKNKILAENEARFAMAFGGGDYFSLSNFLGVNFYGAEGTRTAYQYQVKRYRTIAAEGAWRSVHPVVSFSDVAYPVLGQLLDAPGSLPFGEFIKTAAFDSENRILTLKVGGAALGLASDFPIRWILEEDADLIARYEFDFRPGLSAAAPPRLVAGACEVTRVDQNEAPAPDVFEPSDGDVEVSNFALAPKGLRADENDNGTQQALISRAAPAFRADFLSGGEFSLADARGKVLVLDFWATWCPNCALSWAHMKKVEKAFADASDVLFYGVNLDADNHQKIHAYMERFDVHTPQLLDASREIAAAYRVIGTPAIAVIGKDGVVREIRAGQWPSMAEDLIARIRAAAAE